MGDALIVGAGIGGLCAAHAMRRVGWNVAVCEQAVGFREVGAGISLWANALRALDHLGIGTAVRSIAHCAAAGEFRLAEGKRLLRVDYRDLERERSLPPTLWMLHRAELVGALSTGLPEGCVQFGMRLAGIRQDGRGVEVSFEGGGTRRADVLICADGIRSVSRGVLKGAEPIRYSGYTCWRGVAQVDASVHDPGLLMEIFGHGRRFGVTPLRGGRVYWFAVSDEPAGGRDDDARQALRERFSKWAAPVSEIIERTPPEAIIRNDIVDRPPGGPWHFGRVVLVGDAAHPMTPNLGQGGCMAIEDAAVLGRCMARHGDIPAALAMFEHERRGRTDRMVRDSWQLGRIAQGSTPIARLLRNWLTALTPPRMAFKRLSGLAAYDTGPLGG